MIPLSALERNHLHFLGHMETKLNHKVDLKPINNNFQGNYYHQILHDYLQSPYTLRVDSKLHQNSHILAQN